MDNIAHYWDMQDASALLFFIFCWFGYGIFTRHEAHSDNNLLAVTNRYRMQWMREMLKREQRTMDSIMVGNLLRSISFFANTTLLIAFGLMTLLGNHERIGSVLSMIPFAKPTNGFVGETKIFLLIIIFVYAFFKYSWSLRQYNYAGIFVAAAPSSKDRLDEHESIAAKGMFLVANAAKHFNSGLRAYYFGLAALAWFIHPYLFITATGAVVLVTYRREYRSSTLRYLLQ